MWCLRRRPCYGLGGFFFIRLEKAAGMETKLYVGNLPRSILVKELDALFGQAGDVTAVQLVTDRLRGGSMGYAYITMSAQSEADKAVSMFNTFSWEDRRLKVALVRPRGPRGAGARY